MSIAGGVNQNSGALPSHGGGHVTDKTSTLATKPQRLNRQSVSPLNNVEPSTPPAGDSASAERKSLQEYSIEALEPSSVRPRINPGRSAKQPASGNEALRSEGRSQPDSPVSRDERKVARKFATLHKTLGKLEGAKNRHESPTTARQHRQQVKHLQNQLKKIAIAQKDAGKLPAAGHVAEKENIQGRLGTVLVKQTDALKAAGLKREEHLRLSSESKLGGDLKKLQNRLSSLGNSQARTTKANTLKGLEKQLAKSNHQLSDAKQLTEQVVELSKKAGKASKAHSGIELKEFSKQLTELKAKTEGHLGKAQTENKSIRTARDTARKTASKAKKENQVDLQTLKRQLQRETKKINQEVRRQQERLSANRQRRQERAESKTPESEKRLASKRPGVTKPSAGRSSQPQMSRAGTKQSRAVKHESVNMVKFLSGISPARNKTQEQLEKQLFAMKSPEDVKQWIADRKATRVSIQANTRFKGLLAAAVTGMAKNSKHAESMNMSFIEHALQGQESEIKHAVRELDITQTDNLESRFKKLKSS